MTEPWEKFKGDFNYMSDAEIDKETEEVQDIIDYETEWVEAVALWIAAGRPRDTESGS